MRQATSGVPVALASALFVFGLAGRTSAHGSGMGTGGCGGCHTGGKAATVTITANPMPFEVGQMTTLTIGVSQTNGPSAGFFLDSGGIGSFQIVDAGTKLMGGGVTQTAPRVGSGGVTTFEVAWTPPSTPGGVAFSVWANSANGDGRSSGDGEGIGFFSAAFGCAGAKYYRDADGDRVGAASSGYLMSCSQPLGYALTGADCDDNDQHVYPGAPELCDCKDNDCNGQTDENLPDITYCQDADGDGHGVSGQATRVGCKAELGFGTCDGDCNDDDSTIFPGAPEVCNGRDDNCNGQIDEKARGVCGVGWCARYAPGCNEQCTPGPPRIEECNAFDDDCDGRADNGSDLQLCGKPGFACRDGQCIADSSAGATTSGGVEGATAPPSGDAVGAPPDVRRPSPAATSCSLRAGRRAGFGTASLFLAFLVIARKRRRARAARALLVAMAYVSSACSSGSSTAVATGGEASLGPTATAGAANVQIVSGGSSGMGSSSSGATSAAGTSDAAGAASGAGVPSTTASAASNSEPAAIDLFNGSDLSGFKVYRQNAERAPGTLLSNTEALAIFKPENGALHVYAEAPDQSAQVHYTLMTASSYGKYVLTWEYKWGTKKFAPYTDLTKYPRDAGVLWHVHGDITQLWPASIEFQNKLGSTGDIFALYARCTSFGSAGDGALFAEGGKPVLVDGSNGFVQHGRSANYEVDGGWTPSTLRVDGDSAVYSVNGHVVNRVFKVTTASGIPVTSGPIAWQAEQAEVFYRNLRIQVLQ